MVGCKMELLLLLARELVDETYDSLRTNILRLSACTRSRSGVCCGLADSSSSSSYVKMVSLVAVLLQLLVLAGVKSSRLSLKDDVADVVVSLASLAR